MDMMQTLSQELSVPRGQIESAVRLMDEGNTIPFIARYRKEATGGLDDTVLRNLSERLSYLRNLEKRRQEVFALVEESGKLEGRELEQLRAALERTGGFVDRQKTALASAAMRLDAAADAAVAARKNEYLRLAAKLDALSPLKVLSRGYSIALDSGGRAVKDAKDVHIGDRLTVRLQSGALDCLVEDTYD